MMKLAPLTHNVGYKNILPMLPLCQSRYRHLAAARAAIAEVPNGIPKRNWLGFSSDDEANAIETLLDYLGEPLGE